MYFKAFKIPIISAEKIVNIPRFVGSLKQLCGPQIFAVKLEIFFMRLSIHCSMAHTFLFYAFDVTVKPKYLGGITVTGEGFH